MTAKNKGWGGKRPGAGRKPKAVEKAAAAFGLTAVEFLTAAYCDPNMPVDLRVKAAIAAAPYQQAKLAPKAESKKQQAAAAAMEPADSEWAHLN